MDEKERNCETFTNNIQIKKITKKVVSFKNSEISYDIRFWGWSWVLFEEYDLRKGGFKAMDVRIKENWDQDTLIKEVKEGEEGEIK